MISDVRGDPYLWTLRVIESTVADTHNGSTNSQRAPVEGVHASTTIVLLCCLIDDLVSVQSIATDLPDRKPGRSASVSMDILPDSHNPQTVSLR